MSGEAPWAMSSLDHENQAPVDSFANCMANGESQDASWPDNTENPLPSALCSPPINQPGIPDPLQCGYYNSNVEHNQLGIGHPAGNVPPENLEHYDGSHFQNLCFADSSAGSSVVSGGYNVSSGTSEMSTEFLGAAPIAEQAHCNSEPFAYSNSTESQGFIPQQLQDNGIMTGTDTSATNYQQAENAVAGDASAFDRFEPQGAGEVNAEDQMNSYDPYNGLTPAVEEISDDASNTFPIAAQEDAPKLASSSFADMPHEPSPFDDISTQPHASDTGNAAVDSPLQPPLPQLNLDSSVAGPSSHSRTSSIDAAAGVKFIVGGSGPSSSTNSPYPPYGGASPRDSPVCDSNTATSTTTVVTSCVSSPGVYDRISNAEHVSGITDSAPHGHNVDKDSASSARTSLLASDGASALPTGSIGNIRDSDASSVSSSKDTPHEDKGLSDQASAGVSHSGDEHQMNIYHSVIAPSANSAFDTLDRHSSPQNRDVDAVSSNVGGATASPVDSIENASSASERYAAAGQSHSALVSNDRHTTIGASSSQLGTGSGLVPSNVLSPRFEHDASSPSPGLSYCSSANPDTHNPSHVAMSSRSTGRSSASSGIPPQLSHQISSDSSASGPSMPPNPPSQRTSNVDAELSGVLASVSLSPAVPPIQHHLNTQQVSTGRHHPQPIGAAASSSPRAQQTTSHANPISSSEATHSTLSHDLPQSRPVEQVQNSSRDYPQQAEAAARPPPSSSQDNRELNDSRRDDMRYEPAGFDDHNNGHYDRNRPNDNRGPYSRNNIGGGSNNGQRWEDRQGRYDRPASRGPYGEDRYERPHSRQGHYPADRSSSRQGPPDQRPPSRQGSVGYDQHGYPERSPSRQGNGEDHSYPRDQTRSRYPDERPASRQGFVDDRPRSRQGYSEDRPRSRQGYPDNRPHSRQGYSDNRPTSRQGYPDDRGYHDRPSSRQDYSRAYDRHGYPEYERSWSQSSYDGGRYHDRPGGSYSDQRPRPNYPDDRPRSRQGSPDDSSRRRNEHDRRERRSHYASSHAGSDYDPRYDHNYRYSRDYSNYYQQGYDPYYGYHHQHSGYFGYDAHSQHDYYYQQHQQPYSQQTAQQRGYYDELNQYDQQYGHQNAAYQQPGQHQPAFNYGSAGYEYNRPGSTSGVDSSRGTTPVETAADQFARESGSRPSSRLSQVSSYSSQDMHAFHTYDGSIQPPMWPDQQHIQQQQQPVTQRLTPKKYMMPHARASLSGSSRMIHVLPQQPKDGQQALVNIHDLSLTFPGQSTIIEAAKIYPGPLIKGETHKDQVLSFCQHKIAECKGARYMTDRSSAVLLWRFLELLIRQNGLVVGTDIAELLLEGREDFKEYSVTKAGAAASCHSSNPPSSASSVAGGDEPRHCDGAVEPDGSNINVVANRTLITPHSAVDADQLTQRFRNLLLKGHKKEALDWAMKKEQWGHALYLASKMDAKTHATVMTRFSATAMKVNDPLQTLYQQMSGRKPTAVTKVTDSKWGDWRPHLAIMLSNITNRPETDRKHIITMGDMLASDGRLHASHFCYLMAQVPFGTYENKSCKFVLIGSSHSYLFNQFATDEAIQCTEVYEYALSLATSASFSLVNFQIYKYLYSTRLVDYGLPETALQYCEVLASTMSQNITIYNPALVSQTYNLALRLKYFDPQRQQTAEDAQDPCWLQTLQQHEENYLNGVIQYNSEQAQAAVNMAFNSLASMYSVSSLAAQHTHQSAMQPTHPSPFTLLPPTLNPVAASLANPLTTAGGAVVPGTVGHVQTQPAASVEGSVPMYGTGGDAIGNAGVAYSTAQPTLYPTQTDPSATSNIATDLYGSSTTTTTTSTNQQDNGAGVPMFSADQMASTGPSSDPYTQLQQVNITANNATTIGAWDQAAAQNTYDQSYLGYTATTQAYGEQQQQPGDAVDSTGMLSGIGSATAVVGGADDQQSVESSSMNTEEGVGTSAEPTPTHSTSVPPTSSVGSYDDNNSTPAYGHSSGAPLGTVGSGYRKPSIDSSHGPLPSNQSSTAPPTFGMGTVTKTTAKEKDEKKLEEKKDQNKKSSGWLGGFFSKFKGPNQMILPDDKDKSIIWDEDKKCWVNKDATEEELAKSNAPPPTDRELSSSQLATPASSGPPTVSPGNKFSRQKSRGARGMYVDPMGGNTSQSTVAPSNLFNVLPKSASMPANIFVPPPSEHTGEPYDSTASAAQSDLDDTHQQIHDTHQQPPQTHDAQPQQPQQQTHDQSASWGAAPVPAYPQHTDYANTQEYQTMANNTTHQSQEPSHEETSAPPPPASGGPSAGIADPMMFNPAQYAAVAAPGGVPISGGAPPSGPVPTGAAPTRSTATRGPRYGQRRVYPK